MSSRATTAALIDAASAPYWPTDLFAYYRAREKLPAGIRARRKQPRGQQSFSTAEIENPLRFYCRAVREWLEVLAAAGFQCRALPMSSGTPFANIMLIARPRFSASRPMTDSLIVQ